MTFFERVQSLEFGWRDAVDILIVALIIYGILNLIRGTRAMQMAVGLMVLVSTYFIARTFDLLALEAISREILFYLPFAIIVLFQHEIRRALTAFGRNPLLALFAARAPATEVREIVQAVRQLAAQRIGALIVLERTQSLRMYVETGRPVDAVLSSELLLNIFTPNTPLHDGAVIVHANRVVAAGCFLPLSTTTSIAAEYGTRHRAALGLSEETDAFVVVVSEENGSVAVADDGGFHEHVDLDALEAYIIDGPPRRPGEARR